MLGKPAEAGLGGPRATCPLVAEEWRRRRVVSLPEYAATTCLTSAGLPAGCKARYLGDRVKAINHETAWASLLNQALWGGENLVRPVLPG